MDMIAIHEGYYDRDGFQLNMDFELKPNSLTAVIGPSGAGKSTLLNIIAGFENLQRGNIVLNGVMHNHSSPAARPVSFVFQDHNSFAHMTARQNVAIGLAPDLRLSQQDWKTVDDALEHVGIGHLAERKPGEMSGGERQRIALARVLVRQKPILLLDEAFAALGPALRKEMLLLVKRLQSERQLTVLMVTHEPADAMLIAEQVMFVAENKVRRPEPLKSFFASRDEMVRQYLGTASPA
jgi:thiamine transport system ATP-binding protein